MDSVTTVVRKQQAAWARNVGRITDTSGYTSTLQDNLFQDLSPCAAKEFASGDGGELGADGGGGKMQALHSSSALACNVFDYWRGRDTGPLAAALGINAPICSIRFEQKFPTGLRGRAPNLDVVAQPASGPVLAIESKFLEPYSGRSKSGFKGKYFESKSVRIHLWSAVGLRACQEHAEAIEAGTQKYLWLHAEQLLKHILGLSRTGAPWSLLYLWYDPKGAVGSQHRDEAQSFAKAVSQDGVGFNTMTYQELFAKVASGAGANHAQYVAYLRDRYFPVSG